MGIAFAYWGAARLCPPPAGGPKVVGGRQAVPTALKARPLAGRRCRRAERVLVAWSGPRDVPLDEDGEPFLLPEEDEEIPGTYEDAINPRTRLGKAVSAACDELDTLGELEREQLEKAEGLLKQFGFKGSLFAVSEDNDEDGKA